MMNAKNEITVRIDKWLWAVRIYKTRSLSADACKAGKIKLNGLAVKASRETKPGDVYNVSMNPIIRTIRVKALLQNRVSAKLVQNFMEDLTTPQELEKLKNISEIKQGIRPHGIGRPTKKERRDLDNFSSH